MKKIEKNMLDLDLKIEQCIKEINDELKMMDEAVGYSEFETTEYRKLKEGVYQCKITGVKNGRKYAATATASNGQLAKVLAEIKCATSTEEPDIREFKRYRWPSIHRI